MVAERFSPPALQRHAGSRADGALSRRRGNRRGDLLVEQESNLRRSMLTRVQVLRIESLYLRAQRRALAMASANRSNT